MGDEGMGVDVVRHVSRTPLPGNVQFLDGGTGSFLLLEPMQRAKRVILIDSTIDGKAPRTVTRLAPRFSYLATLTAQWFESSFPRRLQRAYPKSHDRSWTKYSQFAEPRA